MAQSSRSRNTRDGLPHPAAGADLGEDGPQPNFNKVFLAIRKSLAALGNRDDLAKAWALRREHLDESGRLWHEPRP